MHIQIQGVRFYTQLLLPEEYALLKEICNCVINEFNPTLQMFTSQVRLNVLSTTRVQLNVYDRTSDSCSGHKYQMLTSYSCFRYRYQML